MADGHLGKCKKCCKLQARVRRRTNPAVQEYDRMRSKQPERAAKRVAVGKAWRLANPEKYRAQNTVNNAIRDGKLKRQPCETCGRRAHAHHDDYSKPLDVRWLCALHHQRDHHPFEMEAPMAMAAE